MLFMFFSSFVCLLFIIINMTPSNEVVLKTICNYNDTRWEKKGLMEMNCGVGKFKMKFSSYFVVKVNFSQSFHPLSIKYQLHIHQNKLPQINLCNINLPTHGQQKSILSSLYLLPRLLRTHKN